MEINIRVLVFPVGQEPFEELIPENDTLARLQKMVGGWVEVIHLEVGLDLWVNDEGRINGMPPNRWVSGIPIHGTMVLARSTQEGSTVSITDEDVDMYRHEFPILIPINSPPPEE